MKVTCLACKHCTSLLQVHWWNIGNLVNLWVRSRLTSLTSTGLTSGSPPGSTCLPCTPQPIPPLPPTTPLRDQPSPTVRVASTDDVMTHARRAGTTRHLHGVLKKYRRRRSTEPSNRNIGTCAAERRRRRVCSPRLLCLLLLFLHVLDHSNRPHHPSW